jgi:hypothetical protein
MNRRTLLSAALSCLAAPWVKWGKPALPWCEATHVPECGIVVGSTKRLWAVDAQGTLFPVCTTLVPFDHSDWTYEAPESTL